MYFRLSLKVETNIIAIAKLVIFTLRVSMYVTLGYMLIVLLNHIMYT